MAAVSTPSTAAESSEHRLPDALLERVVQRVTAVGDREWREVTTPLTEEVLGQVPVCTAEDVAAAAHRGRRAQQDWAQRSFRERARVIHRFHDLVLRERGKGLDLIQLESGKVRFHAFEEIADASIVANYYGYAAETHLRPRRRVGMLPVLTRVEEQRVPKGLVGFIAPWNYPLSMAITDIIPALMAGNACLLKPASTAPLTALWAVDLMYEAGLPEDLITVVTGSGSQLGEPIIDEADFITFTGSTETGRWIAAQCGQRLTGCALELGGKNPVIVRADANLDKAVAGVIRGAFSSAGQLCISFERAYVHEDVREEFVRRLVAEVDQLELSTDLSYGPGMGSLHSRDQLRKAAAHVEDAVDKGATVLTGGRARPDVGPLFYAPTVLTDVTPDMHVATQETFGPVLSLYGFGDDEEAVALANDTEYGLNASIWTRDVDRGMAMAREINAGTVNINEAYASAWGSIDAPMGGFKDSGLGRRHGREGIIKYTETKNIAAQRLLSPTDLPFLDQEQTAKVFDTVLRVLHRNPFVTLRRP